MIRKFTLIAATGVTLITGGLWLLTGRELFTQETRFVSVERKPNPDDFLDVVRADDDGLIRETIRQDGLRLGLLPSEYPRPGAWTPRATWLSVVTILIPLWILATVIVIVRCRCRTDQPGASTK